MKIIPLTHGLHSLIDDKDYDEINTHKWRVLPTKTNNYAVRTGTINGSRTTIYMHREIIGIHTALNIDHRDNNGLNNTRNNLRVCSQTNNLANSRPIRGGTSKYKGVHWHKLSKSWEARIGINGKRIHIGSFTSDIDAAMAYNSTAQRMYGEFARLNEVSAGG